MLKDDNIKSNSQNLIETMAINNKQFQRIFKILIMKRQIDKI